MTRSFTLALLCLIVCLGVAGCANDGQGPDDDKNFRGAYGGLSGGMLR